MWKIWLSCADQDLVARTKFFWLYKRGGHRVIINKLGDLIVRPSPLEASLRVLPLQGSVNHHLLTSYLESIVSVFVSQFSKQQRESSTMARIVEIVRHDKPLKVGQACLHSSLKHYLPMLASRPVMRLAMSSSGVLSGIPDFLQM